MTRHLCNMYPIVYALVYPKTLCSLNDSRILLIPYSVPVRALVLEMTTLGSMDVVVVSCESME